MKVVVTGARGRLGRELCRRLGADAVPLAREALDVTDRSAVLETMRRLEPHLVINCAAYTDVDRAESQPEACRAVNATAVAHLAEACTRLDRPLVQISTDYVFSGDRGRTIPYREDEPPSPRGVYAETKLEGERAAAEHAKHVIVRTCGLYARPTDRGISDFVRTMLGLVRSGQVVRVVCDQHCTPSYMPHVAAAILFLGGYGTSSAAPWGTYHVTNEGATTWHAFALEIFRHAGLDIRVEPITTKAYGAAAPRPAYSVLDTTAYHRLGGPGLPSWKSALAEYIAELHGAGENDDWQVLPPGVSSSSGRSQQPPRGSAG